MYLREIFLLNAGKLYWVLVFWIWASSRPHCPSRCRIAARAEPGAHYPALTADHPAAQIYERELWEQTGLQPDGHPWLKPIRFHRSYIPDRDAWGSGLRNRRHA